MLQKLQSQLKVAQDAGFKSFGVLEYFFIFADNQGKSVREMFPPEDVEEGNKLAGYQQALRYFRILSDGTNRDKGMHLLYAKQVDESGKKPEVYLTDIGLELLERFKVQ